MNIKKIIRNNLRVVQPYKPSLTLEQISDEMGIPAEKIYKFDSGENIYAGRYQNKKLPAGLDLYLYPDPMAVKLCSKLGSYTGVPADWITCGNGSDELIDLLIRVFISSGEEIIISPPTFPMYECYAKLQDAKVIKILRNDDLYPDIKKIEKSISKKTKLVFIDSPGNPSSTIVSNKDFERLLSKGVIVVADEAYFEFNNKTALKLMSKYSNLAVLRTFSKWAGLAGLRVGYMIADPVIINTVNSIRAPYNVNSAGQAVACEVLDNREKFLNEISQLITYRNKLIEKLRQFPQLNVYPSEGAYVLFKPAGSSEDLRLFLRNRGFLVKLINYPKLENWLRMNLIKEKEAQILFKLLKEYYGI